MPEGCMAHTQDKKEALIGMIRSKLQAHKVKILDKIVCHAATQQQYGGLIEQHFFLTYHVETRTRGAKNFCIFQDGKKMAVHFVHFGELHHN